eukprot:1485929-Alexandrium_andersonii.AAC.1
MPRHGRQRRRPGAGAQRSGQSASWEGGASRSHVKFNGLGPGQDERGPSCLGRPALPLRKRALRVRHCPRARGRSRLCSHSGSGRAFIRAPGVAGGSSRLFPCRGAAGRRLQRFARRRRVLARSAPGPGELGDDE